MAIGKIILSAVLGYLLGSVSFSVVLSRSIFGKDVREKGSGNAGATNMGRVFGKTAGILTLLGDALKAVVALELGAALGGSIGYAAAGCGCMLGHCFPLYYHFKGGKGVVVGVVIGFWVHWSLGVAAFAAFILSMVLTRRVSLGSVMGCVAAAVVALFVVKEPAKIVLVVFCVVLIIARHRENIIRLLHGEEKEFHFGSKNS